MRDLSFTVAILAILVYALAFTPSQTPLQAVVNALNVIGSDVTLRAAPSVDGIIEATTSFIFPGGSSQTTAVTTAVPSNAVAFFASTCPSGWVGWNELDGAGTPARPDARGRAFVGLVNAGTLAGTVGSALTQTNSDAGGITHSHSFTPTGTVSSTFTGSQATSSSSDHTHTFSGTTGTENTTTTGTSTGAVSVGAASHTHTYSGTTAGASDLHSHTLTAAGTVSSTFSGDSGTSGTVLTGAIMPYIQLRACLKS